MGTTDEPGACPATTWKVIAVFTRVPPWSSLPREETCPIIAVPSSSSATFARKVTWVGPNFTVRVVSYEPSSNRSPSFAPGTQSTTARGSDSTSHTIRGAAGTSTRSLISITMRESLGQIFTYDIRSARMLKMPVRAERSKGERRVFQEPVESLTPLRRLTLRILDSPDASLSRLSTGFG